MTRIHEATADALSVLRVLIGIWVRDTNFPHGSHDIEEAVDTILELIDAGLVQCVYEGERDHGTLINFRVLPSFMGEECRP